MITMETVPMKRDSFSSRAFEGETIIVNYRGDKLHTLNETASFIWNHIDGERDLGAILKLLCAQFNAPLRAAEQDILRFVDELFKTGIVLLGE
jgi:hypothetical protein